MGHVAKHSAGAGSGSNRDRSTPPGKPAEETPAEPVAVKPGEPGDRPGDTANSVVVEPLDPATDRTVLRPTVPGRTTRRWWQLGRGAESARPGTEQSRRSTRERTERGSSRGRHAERPEDREPPFRWRPAGSDGAAQPGEDTTRHRGPSYWSRSADRNHRDEPPWTSSFATTADEADDDDHDDGLAAVKLREGERSRLRPSAPTGTPTYEGSGIEDTAVLPKIGQAIQTQRIWTTRPDPEEAEERAEESADEPRKNKKIDVTSLLDVGMKLLPEVDPDVPEGPVTNARWAALVRSAARRLIWTLPAAGVVAAAASIGAMVGGGPAHYLSGEAPFRLIAWVTSVWLAMVAMIALVGVLSAVRSRAAAVLGLMLGILGGVSMLMWAAVPPETPIWGLSAKTLALSCAGIYSAGWMAMGWSVFRSRMFARGDGLMLICAGPMVGIAGLWMSPFHTAGALLLFAAGLGIAWKSGSTLRAVRAGRAPAPPARPLELAEIRPRRAKKAKPPKPAKQRRRRGKQEAKQAAKQEAKPAQETRPAWEARPATGRAEVTRSPWAPPPNGQASQPPAAKPPQSPTAKASPPAKDEKPSRRPGKRRLRLGATTRETAPEPNKDNNRKR
ncbi:hypothetical protein [Asanoa iriomotensis]|uniref:Uncharacterized protein n=1 Tax=Asanoa iriomotensis TaxID=234613 RepID=A0ABQ4C9P3_9ACTN|nr:hypothetical protein [Asanoa iriomotensis]GIF59507.1 hypothetical protein Air01nite_56020 [Asanoa iriomotensis]